MAAISAIIFDLGNVVAYFDYTRAAEKFGRSIGLSGPEFLERARPLGLSTLIREYESGRLTSAGFIEKTRSALDLPLSDAEFAAAWSDIFWLNESIAAMFPRLKAAGYRLVLGSNTNEMHARQFQAQFAADLAHFDERVLSYQVGYHKPERGFYEACRRAADRPASECLFIDDMAENVAGARDAGLHAWRYQDHSAFERELKRRGIGAG